MFVHKIAETSNMLVKTVLLRSKKFQHKYAQKGLVNILSVFGNVESRNISNGILRSDTPDIEIPTKNIPETLFDRFESFQKFKAIVSISCVCDCFGCVKSFDYIK